jgi:multisubunit Na+/H+ antiporter MnhF subunit
VNRWQVVAVVLLCGAMLPALVTTAHGSMSRRLVAYEYAQIAAVPLLLCIGEAVQRSVYVDVALVLAVLSPAVLVFTRFFGGER